MNENNNGLQTPAAVRDLINAAKNTEATAPDEDVEAIQEEKVKTAVTEATNDPAKQTVENKDEPPFMVYLNKAKALYIAEYKKSKMKAVVLPLVGMFALNVIITNSNKRNNAELEPQVETPIASELAPVQDTDSIVETIELEGFAAIEIPEIEPITPEQQEPETLSLEVASSLNELAGIASGTENNDEIDNVNSILLEENNEKINSLEIQVDTFTQQQQAFENFASSELQALLEANKKLQAQIASMTDEISSKSYDLGYEKDRPKISLKATLPAPEDCAECMAHASFYHDNVKYQAANGKTWHSFQVEVSGNRMSLSKNGYVYDYWVGQ